MHKHNEQVADFELYSLTEADDRTVAKATLLEASLSRMFYHFVGGEDEAKRKTVLILTASRQENTPAQNNKANKELRQLVKAATYGKGEQIGYVKVIGTYVEVDSQGKKKRVKEDSTLIVAPSDKADFMRRLGIALGAKFNQDSVFFATDGKAMLIYTRDITDTEGRTLHRKGDVIPLGAFRPQALGSAYTKVKGSTFAFDWIGECFERPLDKPSRILSEEVSEDDISDFLDNVDDEDDGVVVVDRELDDYRNDVETAERITAETHAQFADGTSAILFLDDGNSDNVVERIQTEVLPFVTYNLNDDSVIGWGTVGLADVGEFRQDGDTTTVELTPKTGLLVFGNPDDLKLLGYDLCQKFGLKRYAIFDPTTGQLRVFDFRGGEIFGNENPSYFSTGFSHVLEKSVVLINGLTDTYVANPSDYNDATVRNGLTQSYKKNRGTLSAFSALDKYHGIVDDQTVKLRHHC